MQPAAAGATALLALCLLLSVVCASGAVTPEPRARGATPAAGSRGTTRPRNVTATGPKIVGGRDATPGEFPYQVSVRSGSRHFCGGAVLNATTVVTAAHCVYERSPADIAAMTVMAGSIVQSKPGAVVGVKEALIHPDYGFVYQEYDIALLFLDQPLPLSSDSIWPVRLQEYPTNEGVPCVASGWGRTATTQGSGLPDTLQAVDLPIIDATTCNALYMEDYDYAPVIESQICAGYVEGRKDSCQGDSGGPLVCTRERLLTGIVSWGAGCAEPGFPGVYSDVAFLLPWIKENVVLDDDPVPVPPTQTTPATGDAARSTRAWALQVACGFAVVAFLGSRHES